MKIRWKYFWLAVVSIILAGNLLSAYIRTLALSSSVIYSFETRSAEFQFRVDPAGGTDVALMEQEFQKFLNLHPQTEERELFRTFEIRPWEFWNWYHFMTGEVYAYPYKEQKASR
jgi:nicotinic acid phosphoribosyltransferase